MKHELSSRILKYILIRNTEVRTSEVIVNFVKLRWWYTYLKAPSPRQTTCKSGLPNLCFFSASVSCRCSHFFRFNLIGTILILIISFISFRLLPIFLLLFHWSLLLPFRLRFNQLLRDRLLFTLDCQWTWCVTLFHRWIGAKSILLLLRELVFGGSCSISCWSLFLPFSLLAAFVKFHNEFNNFIKDLLIVCIFLLFQRNINQFFFNLFRKLLSFVFRC